MFIKYSYTRIQRSFDLIFLDMVKIFLHMGWISKYTGINLKDKIKSKMLR